MMRILLADEETLFLSTLADSVAELPDATLIGVATSLVEVLPDAEKRQPDVLVISAVMLAGERRWGSVDIAVAEGLRSALPHSRILLLAGQASPRDLMTAVAADLDGYVTHDQGLDGLRRAIYAVYRHEVVVPASMLRGLLASLRERIWLAEEGGRLRSLLSGREREVLNLLAKGHDHRSIAKELTISPQTAQTHIQNLLNRLGVHSRAEAVGLAVRHGIVRSR